MLDYDNEFPAKIDFEALTLNNLADNDDVYKTLCFMRKESIETYSGKFDD